MPKKKEKDEDYVYSSDEDDEPEQRMSSPAKLKRKLKKCSLEKQILEHNHRGFSRAAPLRTSPQNIA